MREKGKVVLMGSILLYTIRTIPTTTWLVNTAIFNKWLEDTGSRQHFLRLTPSTLPKWSVDQRMLHKLERRTSPEHAKSALRQDGLLQSQFLPILIPLKMEKQTMRVPVMKLSVSTNHVVVGIFLIVYSSIDPINTNLPFSLIMCCNTQRDPSWWRRGLSMPGTWGQRQVWWRLSWVCSRLPQGPLRHPWYRP